MIYTFGRTYFIVSRHDHLIVVLRMFTSNMETDMNKSAEDIQTKKPHKEPYIRTLFPVQELIFLFKAISMYTFYSTRIFFYFKIGYYV